MTWLTVTEWDGEPPVQVVPEVVMGEGWQHILDDDCWCRPYRDPNQSRILIHRKDGEG